MATGQLHRDGDPWVGHEDDDTYLLYLSADGTLKLGRDVQADEEEGRVTLWSPHTPARLTVFPTSEFIRHADGQRVQQLPVIRRLLADPSQPQVIFAA